MTMSVWNPLRTRIASTTAISTMAAHGVPYFGCVLGGG